jgi:hypothetical protein
MKACQQWHEMPIAVGEAQGLPQDDSIASGACDVLEQKPDDALSQNFTSGIAAGIGLCLAAAVVWVGLCRLLRAMARTRLGRAIGPERKERPDLFLLMIMSFRFLGATVGLIAWDRPAAGPVLGVAANFSLLAALDRWERSRRAGEAS